VRSAEIESLYGRVPFPQVKNRAEKKVRPEVVDARGSKETRLANESRESKVTVAWIKKKYQLRASTMSARKISASRGGPAMLGEFR
jgi:hypothetical protein